MRQPNRLRVFRSGEAVGTGDPVADATAASRASRMVPAEIAWMLAQAVRNPTVYACAAGTAGIGPRLFGPTEAMFVLFWKAARAAIAARPDGRLPDDHLIAKDLVAQECVAEVARDPSRGYYTRAVESAVLAPGELLDGIFEVPVAAETEERALRSLSRFLVERAVSDPYRNAVAGLSEHDTISDPLVVIEAIERKAREVAGVTIDPAVDLVQGNVDEFRPRGRRTRTTGRQFLDRLLGGGYAPAEAYAIVGPTSGGKTCLMANIIVDAVENGMASAAELGAVEDIGYWYYFTYELREGQLIDRMHAYGARVHFESFNGPLSSSANPDSLKPYEREPWVNSPGNPILGEVERSRGFRRRFRDGGNRLKIVDYSGRLEGKGTGGIEEVRRYLQKETAIGRRVAGFVIDYAGIVVSRYLIHNRLDPKSEYFHLKSFGDEVRNRICVPLNCTGWVLHQLHGDAARRPSGARQHHSNTLGCHNFADNFDYGIQFGMYHGPTGLLKLDCSKHRSSARTEDGVIARFDGRFGAFLDPDVDYTVDPMTGTIVRRDYLDCMPVGPSGAQMAAAPVGPHGHRRGPVDPSEGLI